MSCPVVPMDGYPLLAPPAGAPQCAHPAVSTRWLKGALEALAPICSYAPFRNLFDDLEKKRSFSPDVSDPEAFTAWTSRAVPRGGTSKPPARYGSRGRALTH